MKSSTSKADSTNTQAAAAKSRKIVKPADVQVGCTYPNRGAGKTHRTVIAIGPEHRPRRFLSENPAPDEDGVLYEQNGKRDCLYISSFAAWCGQAVE
jgi:hypothetical protein